MIKNEFYNNMKNTLLKIPSARLASGGKEILMRCRYCSDSVNQSSAHMYVKLPYDDNIMLFNCFKCHTKGIVTHKTLLDWGIYDDVNIMVEVSKYNTKVSKLDKNRKYVDKDVYVLYNKMITDNKLSEIKLKYINKRLGTSLSYEDLLEKKIILNLLDLLNSNNISKYSRHENIINQLDQNFIGFISQDNAFINMRNLTPGKVDKRIDFRYVNYSIFEKYDNSQKYYTLPTTIDLSNPNRIKIHIAEGPFDILSIYYNLRKDNNNCIYSSILGSGYLNICKHFINTMKLINIEFHIYIDADVNYNTVNEIRDLCYVFQIPFYLHRNLYNGEKDFGVPIDRIQEQIERII